MVLLQVTGLETQYNKYNVHVFAYGIMYMYVLKLLCHKLNLCFSNVFVAYIFLTHMQRDGFVEWSGLLLLYIIYYRVNNLSSTCCINITKDVLVRVIFCLFARERDILI